MLFRVERYVLDFGIGGQTPEWVRYVRARNEKSIENAMRRAGHSLTGLRIVPLVVETQKEFVVSFSAPEDYDPDDTYGDWLLPKR
jgi:hypothetical protein